jgi:hypothetical protein
LRAGSFCYGINMSEQANLEHENPKERQVYNSIKILHEDFLLKVPQYGKHMWDPRLAIKDKSGSCMAELLYVAGGLLANGTIREQDITIGFSKDHGIEQPTGFVGKTGKKYAHTFMLLTIGNGVTLEADFRANRADEEPRLQRLLPDEQDVDQLYLGTLADAITEYAKVEGASGPTVDELIQIHIGGLYGEHTKTDDISITDSVLFDEDF